MILIGRKFIGHASPRQKPMTDRVISGIFDRWIINKNMADTGEEEKGTANGLNGMQRQFLGNSACLTQSRLVFYSEERASWCIV